MLSKLIEHLVGRLYSEANLLPELQSAYRPHRSTETAVLKILNYTLRTLDSDDLAFVDPSGPISGIRYR